MRSRSLIAVLALSASVEAFGAGLVLTDGRNVEIPVDPAATVWLRTPYGSIDVVGIDGNKMSVNIQRYITGTDEQALADGRDAVVTTLEGDSKVRFINTIFPKQRDPRWSAIVNYTVRVPRHLQVKITGEAMDHIRVSQMTGNVTIHAFSGTIILSNIGGASTVETVNGRVIYDYPQRPAANARVQAVNADIDIYAPRDAAFDWIASTFTGNLLTTFDGNDMKGIFIGTTFRGRANNTGGPTLTTSTVSGRVMLLAKGTAPAQARRMVPERRTRQMMLGPDVDLSLPPKTKVQFPIVTGDTDWLFGSNVADISVGEMRGSTRIETGGGEVELGVVYGACVVNSHGGPINLGDIMGPLEAHTKAGDVIIRAARSGGLASTEGGIVRVTYAGAPMNLRSGGGDIVVQQTSGPIDAATRSGDISITMDPRLKTQRVTAKSSQGNVTLVVSPNFAADVDALVETTDDTANSIHSDFNLTLHRETLNGKVRIHATGKINGGGDRVELSAEDGSINIASQVITPMIVATPRP